MAEKKTKAAGNARGRGRPSLQAADVKRQALIDAARKLLVKNDPALLTRLMVATEAGVDPNLIRYYFGHMDQLLTEVIAGTHRQARDEMAARSLDSGPVERLRYKVHRSFRMFVENPNHHKLVALTLYGNETSEAHSDWSAILESSLDDLRDILKSGQHEGLMREVEPRFLHMLIISACEFWASNEPLISLLFGANRDKGYVEQRYVDFIFDILMNGLRP